MGDRVVRELQAARWASAVLIGLVVVMNLSLLSVGAGWLGGFYFEGTDAALYREFCTAPLLTFGASALLLSLVGMGLRWASGHYWPLASGVVLLVATVSLVVGGLEWRDRSHPEAQLLRSIASLDLPDGFRSRGIGLGKDSSGIPVAVQVWDVHQSASLACDEAAISMAQWAHAPVPNTSSDLQLRCNFAVAQHGHRVTFRIKGEDNTALSATAEIRAGPW